MAVKFKELTYRRVKQVRPYVAGYYAYQHGLPDDRESVLARVDELIALGQGLEVING